MGRQLVIFKLYRMRRKNRNELKFSEEYSLDFPGVLQGVFLYQINLEADNTIFLPRFDLEKVAKC